MRMKKFLLVAVCAIGTLAASAQKTEASPVFFSTEKADQGVTFGLRVGLNFANVSAKSGRVGVEMDSRTAFHVGVVTDIPIVKSLYVETGLYLQSKGAKYNYSDDLEISGSPLYLQIPLLLSYRYDFSDDVQLQVNFGPYFAYGIGGKMKLTLWDDNSANSASYDFFGDDYSDELGILFDNATKFNRFDCGLQVGAGFTFAKHYYVGFAYEFGLTNMTDQPHVRKDDKYSMKNSNWMLGIGYNF